MLEIQRDGFKIWIGKNMLRLVAIFSVTATCLYALMSVGFAGLLAKDLVLQILSIQSGTLVSLCGLEAYANREKKEE